MSKKQNCHLPCPSDYDKLIIFLKAPNELNADQEIETRDWSDWTETGKSYSKIHTAGSRAVYVASQTHQQVDAVIECPWGSSTRTVGHAHAIQRRDFDGTYIYFQVIAAVNVDFNNQTMLFICRVTDPNGIQDE